MGDTSLQGPLVVYLFSLQFQLSISQSPNLNEFQQLKRFQILLKFPVIVVKFVNVY